MKEIIVYSKKYNDRHAILVDDDDYIWLSSIKWHVYEAKQGKKNFYARTAIYTPRHTYNLLMHRLVANAPDELFVDHINRNGLDNRKENLRYVTRKENVYNAVRFDIRDKSSQYIGVSFDARYKKPWKATIMVDNKSQYLGSFATEIEAAIAYNNMALKHRGNLAVLNDIVIDEPFDL